VSCHLLEKTFLANQQLAEEREMNQINENFARKVFTCLSVFISIKIGKSSVCPLTNSRF
jgi:hypothetical protein